MPSARPALPWRRLLVATLAASALLGGCATLDEKQREWIFQPSERSWAGGLAAAQGMDDVWVDYQAPSSAAPVRLHGLWAPAERADAQQDIPPHY